MPKKYYLEQNQKLSTSASCYNTEFAYCARPNTSYHCRPVSTILHRFLFQKHPHGLLVASTMPLTLVS